jgi:hypothetical protein
VSNGFNILEMNGLISITEYMWEKSLIPSNINGCSHGNIYHNKCH